MENVGPLVTTFEVPTITFHDGFNFRRAATVFTVPSGEDVELQNTSSQSRLPLISTSTRLRRALSFCDSSDMRPGIIVNTFSVTFVRSAFARGRNT